MRILGIETSCDETSAALVENGTKVFSNIVSSSMKEMSEYGGVVPEIAARRQLEYIIPVIKEALKQADMSSRDVDVIAVTKGPGLLTSLLVGVMAARTLASTWKKPLIGVHHTQGHLDSPWLEAEKDIAFPVLTLSVSGGHTELWYRESHTNQTLIGKTRDDAAGEAFDKGATQLGLPYPGGPALSKLAEGGNPHFVEFPRPLLGEDTCDFSYSGLKTALKYTLRDRGGLEKLSEAEKKDIAASYQEAICNHLVSRVEHALELHSDVNQIHIVGGVAANRRLRELIKEKIPNTQYLIPTTSFCTDNAAMIASATFFMTEEMGEKVYKMFETTTSI